MDDLNRPFSGNLLKKLNLLNLNLFFAQKNSQYYSSLNQLQTYSSKSAWLAQHLTENQRCQKKVNIEGCKSHLIEVQSNQLISQLI